jgi:hypothetical protein
VCLQHLVWLGSAKIIILLALAAESGKQWTHGRIDGCKNSQKAAMAGFIESPGPQKRDRSTRSGQVLGAVLSVLDLYIQFTKLEWFTTPTIFGR